MKFSLDRAFHRLISTQVILVVHPRKEDPHAKLALTSIYGGAKAAQEADNVLILQAPLPPPTPGGAAAAPSANGPKWVDVVKNRYAGSLGSVMMAYSGPTCRYYELAAGHKLGEPARPEAPPAPPAPPPPLELEEDFGTAVAISAGS